MVAITISAAGKPPSVARGLPFTVEITGKSIKEVTVGDVKSSLADKFPKVSFVPSSLRMYTNDPLYSSILLAKSCPSKGQRRLSLVRLN